MQFDEVEAFDAAEALNILAHDYGLYAVKAELDAIPFRAGPTRDTLEGIDDRGRELYAEWTLLAEAGYDAGDDPHTVPEWAREILEAIQDAGAGERDRPLEGTFTLTLEMGNAGMDTPADIRRALERVAASLEYHTDSRGNIALEDPTPLIKDENGNTVGRYAMNADPAPVYAVLDLENIGDDPIYLFADEDDAERFAKAKVNDVRVTSEPIMAGRHAADVITAASE